MKRSWRDSTLDAVVRQSKVSPDGIVTREKLIEEELPSIIRETKSTGKTPDRTMDNTLQRLRDEDKVEFVDNDGRYRLK